MDSISMDGSLKLGLATRVDATQEEAERYSLQKGDFLFNTRNSDELVGKTAVFQLQEKGWLYNNNIMRVRFIEGIDPQYVNIAFHTYLVRRQLEAAKSKTTSVCAIYDYKLVNIQIPLPPIAQQRRIAAILDRADAVRRKRQEAIALTEELLRSVFLEMFGDPVTNPKQWEVKKLETTFARSPQIGTAKPAHSDGQQIVIRVGEIGGRNVNLDACGRVTLEGQELERFLCEPGDLLLARAIGSESHLGKASILQQSKQTIVFDSHVMRLRFDSTLLLPVFFLQWLKTDGGRARFMREAGRTAVQFNVNAKQISKVEIPLPPATLQQEFENIYTKTLTSLTSYKEGYDLSGIFFNSLLQRAFRGEL